MALVWSRAICTVLFLMAELCRRPLPKLGGLNIFCAHVFKRLPLGFSVFCFVFVFVFVCLFFLSTLGIELTFSLYKNIYSRNLARFARGFLIHATGLSRESIL